MNSPVDPSTGNSEGVVQHTPGPWLYRPDKYDDWGVVRTERGGFICQAKDGSWPGEGPDLDTHRRAGTDPYEANARLIAAAPDWIAPATLLLAIEDEAQITDCLDNDGGRYQSAGLAEAIAGFRAAISKATASNPPTTPPTEQDHGG